MRKNKTLYYGNYWLFNIKVPFLLAAFLEARAEIGRFEDTKMSLGNWLTFRPSHQANPVKPMPSAVIEFLGVLELAV